MPQARPIERWLLKNGLVVLHRQNDALPLAAGTVLLRTGSFYESRRQAGLVSLGCDLLLEGTKRRSARALADRIESIGASLSVQSAEDYAEVDLVAPGAQLERALEVLAEILQQPSFPPGEIQKERAQTLAALMSRRDTIFSLAHDRFNALLYGDHPYGRPVDGFIPSVRALKRADFLAWRRQQLRPDRMILSLVTPWPHAVAGRAIERYFGNWLRPAEPFEAPDIVGVSEPRVSHRERLQAPFEQAYFMTGVLAPAASDSGYLALKVLNTLFGGGMSSRLFLQLREKLGLAYEVSSFFPTRLHPSQWVIYLGLPAERLGLAERKLEELLDDLAAHGPTEAELAQARQMMRGAFLMERQTRRRQSWQAAWWEFLGRPPDYEAIYLDLIDHVTRKHLLEIARTLLKSPRVSIQVQPTKSHR